MGFRRKRREDPRVELTPMVDVVFLLLIFFMISTTFVETPGISIKLPESGSKVVDKEPQEVKVYIDKSGQAFFKEAPIAADELRQRLTGFGDGARQMTFVLLADKDALHGRVVQVMDLAREAGFGKLAIATEQRRTP